MVFPCKIWINQYGKIFYVYRLVEGDKLISVIIKYLEDHLHDQVSSDKDERLQNSTFWHLKLAYGRLTIPGLYLIRYWQLFQGN